jgi:hypothetical protein
VKGVHELYNFEGRKNVKDFILILGSKGPTRNVLLTDAELQLLLYLIVTNALLGSLISKDSFLVKSVTH